MRLKILILTALVFASYIASAQTEEEKSLREFNAGQISKFSSLGQGKSMGLKIHLKFPKSWKSIEGERPHIVRKFAQQDDYALAIILVNKQDMIISQTDINDMLSPEGIRDIMPNGSTFISSNTNLKIEGLKAGLIEFKSSALRMERQFLSFNSFYVFCYKEYFISIQFMVVNKIGESETSVQNRYQKIKPLFYQMFNSVVIDNIWEN